MTSERYFNNADIGPVPIVCYFLKGFSAGSYTVEIQKFKLTAMCNLHFVNFSFEDLALQGYPDQRPHSRLMCVKGWFWGILGAPKNGTLRGLWRKIRDIIDPAKRGELPSSEDAPRGEPSE